MVMNETQLIEIEERAGYAAEALGDAEVESKYAALAAKTDVPALIAALRESYNSGGGGGDLGLLVRNACRARVVSASNQLQGDDRRIAKLCDDVEILSLGVHSIKGEGRVVIDIRLAVGDKPVLG